MVRDRARPQRRTRSRAAGPAATAARPTSASIPSPIEVAAAPDGSVYITNGNAVKRVGPDGIISTVAGGNFGEPLGDGGPATAGAAGLHRRPRRSAPRASSTSATPTTAPAPATGSAASTSAARSPPWPAAGRTRTSCGDGGPGTQATIGIPRGMDVGPDGALYFAEQPRRRARPPPRPGRHHHDLRRPRQRRLGRRRPGRPRPGAARRPRQTSGRGGRARRHRLRRPPRRAENFTGFVRRISPAAADRPGRRRPRPVARRLAGVRVRRRRPARPHRRRDRPGGPCSASPTTPQGRLASITDADGNETQRRPRGRPVAIVAPGGQRTELTVERATAGSPASQPPSGAGDDRGVPGERADGDVHRPARRGARVPLRPLRPARPATRTPAGGVTTLVRVGDRGRLPRHPDHRADRRASTRQVYEARGLPAGGSGPALRRHGRRGHRGRRRGPTARRSATYPDGMTGRDRDRPGPAVGLLRPGAHVAAPRDAGRAARDDHGHRTAPLADPRDPFSFTTLTDEADHERPHDAPARSTARRARWTHRRRRPAARRPRWSTPRAGSTRAERGPGPRAAR